MQNVAMAHWFLRKSKFWFSYIHDLGPKSRYDLELKYSHTCISSIRTLHLPSFSLKWIINGVCRLCDAEGSFCSMLPTCLDSEVAPVDLTPGSLVLNAVKWWDIQISLCLKLWLNILFCSANVGVSYCIYEQTHVYTKQLHKWLFCLFV